MITETSLSAPDATLAVEVVAFLIVLAVVSKFVLPRLRATIGERQAGIAETLAAAAAADARRRAAEADAQEILAAARRQARVIGEQAHATKDYLIAEGHRGGQAEYKWRISRFDRERLRHEELVRQRLVMETTETLRQAIREGSQDEAERTRLTALIETAMARPATSP